MTEMAVDGGILELEEGESLISFINNESTLSPPLILRGGGEQNNQLSTPLLPQAIPETIIEHTTQSDGSIIVKASTSTPHPNGFIDVKIEHYLLPSSNYTSLNAVGEDCKTPITLPIPNKYLTRVEYKTITNDDDDASTVYTALPPRRGDDTSVASSYYTTNGTRRRRRKLNSSGSGKRCKTTPTLIAIAILFVIVIVLVCISVNKDWNKQEEEEEMKKAAADIKKKGNDTDLPDNVPNMTEIFALDHHHHHYYESDVSILH